MCDPEYTRLRDRIVALEAERDRLRSAIRDVLGRLPAQGDADLRTVIRIESILRAALEPAP